MPLPARMNFASFRKGCKFRREDQGCIICGGELYARGMCRPCYSWEMKHVQQMRQEERRV